MIYIKTLFIIPIQCIIIFIGCSSEIENTETTSPVRESVVLKKKAKEGKYVFKDGSVYEGQLAVGKPNGFGRHELVNGDIFEGQYKSGLAHGHGTISYKSDARLVRYIGSWRSGKRDGFGSLMLEDGSELVGDWKNDSMHVGDLKAPKG